MKLASWRRIARVANAVSVVSIVSFLAYHMKYGSPRYEPRTLWIIADWLAPLVGAAVVLIAALVNMTLASGSDEREPPDIVEEAEFQEKLRQLENRVAAPPDTAKTDQ